MGVTNAVLQGLLLGGLYALFAAGLSIMFGVMRIVNLAHGDLSVVAAYIAVLLIGQNFLPLWLVVVLVIPIFAVIGYVLQRTVFQRSLSSDPLATLLVTFGLSIVIQNVLLQTFSADTRTIDAGSFVTGSLKLGGSIRLSWIGIVGLVAAVACIVAIQFFFSRSRTGRMMRAAADDPETASVVGANPNHVYGVATAIAFATVALAGLIFAMRSAFDPSAGPQRLIVAFEAVVIGGLGSLWGTLLGGLALGMTQSVVSFFDPGSALLAGHLVFLAVLAFRPQGIIPARTV
jgi:branched-chain amino acid transport system permease protein